MTSQPNIYINMIKDAFTCIRSCLLLELDTHDLCSVVYPYEIETLDLYYNRPTLDM